MMKLFFGVSGSTVASSVGPDVTIRGNSSISSSHVSSGSITGSTLNNVRCRHIEAENAILINVTADSIIARNGSIVYNIVDDKSIGLNLVEGEVRAGVFQADSSQIVIRSNVSIDGGKAWETKVESNDLSFEEVYNLNAEVCPSTLEKLIAEIHQSTWSKIDTNK